jgi:hypothetical protein
VQALPASQTKYQAFVPAMEEGEEEMEGNA